MKTVRKVGVSFVSKRRCFYAVCMEYLQSIFNLAPSSLMKPVWNISDSFSTMDKILDTCVSQIEQTLATFCHNPYQFCCINYKISFKGTTKELAATQWSIFIKSDASSYQPGTDLFRVDEHGNCKSIKFCLRSLNLHKINYSDAEKKS